MNANAIRRSAPVVRGALRTAHDGIDQAIAEGANLLAAAMRARVQHKVEGTLGQDQLDEMLSGLRQLRDARATYIGVHESLRLLGVGMGIVAEGDWVYKSQDGAEPAVAIAA